MVVAPTFGQALLAVMLDTLGGIVGIAVADPKEPRKRERERGSSVRGLVPMLLGPSSSCRTNIE